METNKQKAIREAWIESQEHPKSEGIPNYNQDGWAKYGGKQKSEWFETLECKEWLGYFFYRPKTLQGIENNNGWISILSESDLPKGELELEFKVGKMIGNKFHLSSGVYDVNEIKFSYQNKYITHYQPITKPQPPIY